MRKKERKTITLSRKQLLIMFLVCAAVLGIGAYSVHTSVSVRGDNNTASVSNNSNDSSAKSDQTEQQNKQNEQIESTPQPGTTDWGGLDFANIPHGDLDAVEQPPLRPVYVKNGEPAFDWYAPSGDTTPAFTSSVSPKRTALEALNILFDERLSDEDWSAKVQAMFHPAGDGVTTYTMSPLPRWWLHRRHFNPDVYCKDFSGVNCSEEHKYIGTNVDEAIRSEDMTIWHARRKVGLIIPNGVKVSSFDNPEEVGIPYYTTVKVPMDDGMWHVTEYCPALIRGVFFTLEGKHTTYEQFQEIASHSAEGTVIGYVSNLTQGIATPEEPCQVIEITAGEQKPFWKIK